MLPPMPSPRHLTPPHLLASSRERPGRRPNPGRDRRPPRLTPRPPPSPLAPASPRDGSALSP
uniref:Predicted protein n=1 Tax=Hordeum vulgare subsp. vulgare TaxID=112509 RepID=F2CZV5_HORVV|nr:predicted protein [Hordeum vulgare subsp. vulgare]